MYGRSRRQQQDALAQARQQGANYAVAAAVNEWRYKVGLDGEPAVGVSISIIDVASGQVVGQAPPHAQGGVVKRSVPLHKKPLTNF